MQCCALTATWLPVSEFLLGQWTSKRREEREAEFAPPSAYFSDERPGRGQGTEGGKHKLAFRWSGAQAGEGGGASWRSGSQQSQQTAQNQPSNPPQAAPSSDNLDDLLSFYKRTT